MSFTGRVLGIGDSSFLRSINVQIVLLVSMVSSMGSIASPTLPAMSSALGIGEARIGLVFTAFTLPAIFALPLIGLVGDVYGRRILIIPGLLLFGGAGLSVGLVDDFTTILALRALQGTGYTAFNSLTVALLGDLLTGSEESAAQGVRVLLNKGTGFAGPTVGGILAGIAWNYPYFLYAAAIPAGILVYLRYDTESSDDNDQEEPTADGGSSQLTDRSIREYGEDMLQLVRNPFIAAILAGGFFRMFLKYTLYTFLALAVVNQYGGSQGYAGFLVGLYSLAGAGIATQSARFTKVWGHSYALIVGFLVASAAFVLFPLAEGVVVLTGLVLLHGVGEGIINPVHKSIMSQSVVKDVRVGLVATNAIVQNVAKTVTPLVLSPVLFLFPSKAYNVLFLLTGGVTLGVTVVALGALLGTELSPSRPST